MYVLLYFLLAPLGAGLMAARAILRFRSEPQRRTGIVVVTLIALALWIGATWLMLLFNFGTAMGLAHTRTPLSGLFPEGWRIYAITAAYATLGWGLFAALGRIPRKEAAA